MDKPSKAVEIPSEIYASQVKLFGKWNCDEVEVGDISLRVNIIFLYINYQFVIYFKIGLYTSQRQSCQIFTTYCWSLSS